MHRTNSWAKAKTVILFSLSLVRHETCESQPSKLNSLLSKNLWDKTFKDRISWAKALSSRASWSQDLVRQGLIEQSFLKPVPREPRPSETELPEARTSRAKAFWDRASWSQDLVSQGLLRQSFLKPGPCEPRPSETELPEARASRAKAFWDRASQLSQGLVSQGFNRTSWSSFLVSTLRERELNSGWEPRRASRSFPTRSYSRSSATCHTRYSGFYCKV